MKFEHKLYKIHVDETWLSKLHPCIYQPYIAQTGHEILFGDWHALDNSVVGPIYIAL